MLIKKVEISYGAALYIKINTRFSCMFIKTKMPKGNRSEFVALHIMIYDRRKSITWFLVKCQVILKSTEAVIRVAAGVTGLVCLVTQGEFHFHFTSMNKIKIKYGNTTVRIIWYSVSHMCFPLPTKCLK